MGNNAAERKLTLAEVVALGIGGMVGGGIFATLGLAIDTAGHAVAIGLALGGVLALLTGYAYAHLGLRFRDDGGSFTYIEHAFGSTAVAGIAGWLLVVGYVGTLALYASTFGAYGAALFVGDDGSTPWSTLLAMLVLATFLALNLAGGKVSGRTELLIVCVKLGILAVFGVAGLAIANHDQLLPAFDRGYGAPIAASALIFVAYEGFELIPNAIQEMDDPQSNLKRALLLSITITMLIYVVIGAVAVANLTTSQVIENEEYALAVAARPVFGAAGFALIGLAALLSTASAINATLFGSARLAMVMAREHALPTVFSMRERVRPVPWVALLVLSLLTAVFVLLADLQIIASLASATFLLIFAGVNIAAFRLRAEIGVSGWIPLLGTLLTLGSLVVLVGHTWRSAPNNLLWIGGVYLAAIVLEGLLVLGRGHRRPAEPSGEQSDGTSTQARNRA
ncbi:MAG: amino acid permease [Gammaproteobacteria bacterium]|nr:amino acid permease [Gammaproteobacteria bacterium]